MSTQLLPVEVETFTVGQLKGRLVKHLFDRYDLGIKRGQVALHQGRKRLPERQPLVELTKQKFTVRFTENAPLTEADAVEILRHRSRNKFK